MTSFIAEFIGTAMLLLLGNGVVANVVLNSTKGNNSGWIVITTGWALAVFVSVVVVSPYSGAHINPAVTIGLAIAGKFAWSNVGYYILAQMLGAIFGSFLVWLAYRDHFATTEDKDGILAVFSTKPAIKNRISNIVTEMIGTFVLVFAIFYFTHASFNLPNMSDNEVIVGLGSIGAFPVALLVWSIGLSLGGPTGYAINLARDLGPRILHAFLPIKNKGGSDWGYAWVPVIGPIMGGAIAALCFIALTELSN
ncbi:MIP/aquaporin family protein [Ichthyobacterium seriolicida]|uniref:Glycerol uptake facilitator protein n=1 Tax=Ichthyobacterium seriolicida TaxID=242600 RepID=A0A1J1EAF5_9FLAO|nr:MIP/aquaporin family protein [Ichthyobacterium seriolicida]BAV94915.1 glycerol uptake facilitator protein [Ichthyobacterium seriolicida]